MYMKNKKELNKILYIGGFEMPDGNAAVELQTNLRQKVKLHY